MNKVPENIIFNTSGCLSLDAIRKYVSGELPSGDVRRVEMHLSGCPLCSDAVEGFMKTGTKTDVEAILQDVREKLFGKEDQKLSVLTNPAPKQKRINRIIYMSLAASIALLITGYFVIRSLVNTGEQSKEMAFKESPAIQNSKSPTTDIQTKDLEEQEKGHVIDAQTSTKKSEEKDEGSADIILGDRERTLEVTAGGNGYYAEPAENKKAPDKDYSGILDSIFPVNGALAESKETEIPKTVNADQKNQEQVTRAVTINDVKFATDGSKSETTTVNEVQTVGGVSKSANMRGSKKKEDKPAAGKEAQRRTDTLKAMAGEEINPGVAEYDKGNYHEAIDRFEQDLRRDKDDQQALYYSGMSYYYNHQYDKAIETLEKVAKNDKSPYYQAAKWQIAQIYTETSQTKLARKVLNEIIDKNGTYKQNALDAIQKLENK